MQGYGQPMQQGYVQQPVAPAPMPEAPQAPMGQEAVDNGDDLPF